MEYLLFCLLGLPLLGFLVSIFIPKKNELEMAFWVKAVSLSNLILTLYVSILWLINGAKPINFHEISLFKTGDYSFYIDLYFDKASMVFLIFSTFLVFLIAKFSQYYLHREEGYKRFFNTFLFFNFGVLLILLSGNFETMFIGWEILGLSSFLLISFYRERYLPVKNAVKIFSIYRIGDIALILVMWLSHHLLNANIAFSDVRSKMDIQHAISMNSPEAILICILIFVSVCVKSALFPFSSWLPRAMEGPTPSSAIFYGSIAVHIGAFLLIRTQPYWENHTFIRICFCSIGILTAVLAYFTARVQSSIKSLIAYSSITQIGLIIVEISLGFEIIALFHITANVFYRTYQLLISPSVVSYKIREQFYHYEEQKPSFEDSFPKKIENTLYSFSIREWNIDTKLQTLIWKPILYFSNLMKKIPDWFFIILTVFFLLITFLQISFGLIELEMLKQLLPQFMSALGLVMVINSFVKSNSIKKSWLLICSNQTLLVLAVVLNQKISFSELMMYVSGVLFAGILGMVIITKLQAKEGRITLDGNHGHIYEHKKLGFAFLIACLALAGFPITPSFIGEDILFSHIEEHQYLLTIFMALSFVLDGVSLIRMYASIFLGPHIKKYHSVAKRSA